MNWQKVNEFVESWTEEHGLPPDLKGRTLTLVVFEKEEDCQFFYPDRTELAHKAFTSALTRLARGRHARTENVTITPEHYRAWLLGEQEDDSEENRSRYIESRYQLLPR